MEGTRARQIVREQADKFGSRTTSRVAGQTALYAGELEYNIRPWKPEPNTATGADGFGHVGIFPEQGANWNFIYDTFWLESDKTARIKSFRYTGAASIVARAAVLTVHCDASRPGLNWLHKTWS